jgi:nucleotide-binding universal stress UspA family protein
MIRMKTILHPTDFSESSKYAMAYAIALAKEFEAELCLLHVVEEVPSMFYLDLSKAPPAVPAMTEIQDKAQGALEELLPAEERGAIRARRVIRVGAPFVEIIRCAKETEARMIVLGTHGRTGLKHLIMGSVAENVVRKSPYPVLTVRNPEHKFEMPA